MTKKYLNVIDNKSLVRDSESRGILNIDNAALNKYKAERKEKQKLVEMIRDYEIMKSDINDIKNMLTQLLRK